MDIRNILKETAFGPAIAYRNLDAMHVGVLRKVASGRFDPEQVSEKVEQSLNDLIGFGLVSDLDYSITPDGIKALDYVDKLGGTVDRRAAIASKNRQPNQHEPDDASDFEPEMFEID